MIRERLGSWPLRVTPGEKFVAAAFKHPLYIDGVLDDPMTQLRTAVRERMADPAGSRDVLTRALTAIVADAHRCGMTAEQMVIGIKREWEHMLDAGIVPHGVEHVVLRDSVVTSAIRAYYV